MLNFIIKLISYDEKDGWGGIVPDIKELWKSRKPDLDDIKKDIEGFSDDVKDVLNDLGETSSTMPDFFETFTPDEYIQSATESLNLTEDQSKAFSDLASKMKSGKVTINSTDDAMVAYATSLRTVSTTTKMTTTATKAMSAAMKVASKVGWMIVVSLAAEALGWVIEKIKTTYEESHKSIKDLTEEIEESASKIKSIKDEFDSLNKTVSETSKRFAELAQEVDTSTGKNVSLSIEEYEEFLDLSNQLADSFSTLPVIYDENGNAIVQLSGDVDTLTENFQQLLNVEKELANQKIVEELPELYKDTKDASDKYEEEIKKYNALLEGLESVLNIDSTKELIALLRDYGLTTTSKNQTEIEEIQKRYEQYQKALNKAGLSSTLAMDSVPITLEDGSTSLETRVSLNLETAWEDYYNEEDIKKKIGEVFDDNSEDIKKQIFKLNSDIAFAEQAQKNTWTNFSNSLLQGLQTDFNYLALSDQMQVNVQKAINSFEWEKLDFENFEEGEKYIFDNLLYPLTSNDEKYNTFQDLFSEFMSLEDGTQQKLDVFYELQEEMDNLGLTLSITPMIEDTREIMDNFYKIRHDIIIDAMGGTAVGRQAEYDALCAKIDQFAKEYSINTQDEIAAFNDAWEKANGDIDKAFEYYLQQLEEKSESQTLPLPDISTTIDNLNTKVKPVLDSLKSAYQDIFTEDGFTLDNVGVDMLNSVKEAISEINEIGGIDIATSTFENFARILTNTTTTEEQAHEAFNSLVTEIIHGTDVTKVSADAYNTLVQSLEEMGVVNASEALNGLKTIQDKIIAQGSDIINITEDEAEGFLKEAEALGISAQWLKTFTLQKAIAENPLDTTKDIEALENLCKVLGVTGEMLEYVNDIKYATQMIEFHEKTGLGAPVEAYQATINSAKQKIQKLLDEGSVFEFDFEFDGGKDDNGSDTSSNTPSDTYFDWIETKLDKLNDQLDKTKEKAEDSLNGWKIRADAFTNAENQINDLIATQEEAKARYLEEANKSGLSQPYIDLVKDGAIDIDKLSNDNPLKEQIESYQEWYDKVKQCDEAIDELNADLKQLYRDKREFRWEVFDYLEDSISRITDEAGYLIELLSSEDLFDDNGNFTKYADATLGLHVSSYDAYMQKASDYAEEIEDLEKQLATGGQEVLDKFNERVDARQEAINAAKNERDAILDLVENSYQKQLDYLNKIIDKKKESLNAEKNLYEYQRDIQNKTKNISSLQKQYDALKNSDSEEDIAKAQQILVKLEEAKSDLEQTEYEKMISDTESMLDTLSSEYEQWINEKLENSDELLTSIRDSLAPDGEIVNTLKEIAGKNNTFVSDELTSFISDGANSSINSYLDEIIKLLGGDDSFFGNAGSKIKGYASGTKRSGKEWAWTQEKGVEFIRTKDGALLTPLNNSMVFNNESSKRLWEFSQNPSAFLEKFGMNNIIQPIFNIPKLPNIERPSNQTPINNITHMEVILPNVTNYDDFMNRIQNDKRFDNIVTASMNSKMTGSNSLSKFRF